MAANGGKKGPLLSEINVTPLVDVMLVLLIIFMVTAPMMTRGVEVDLPETSAKALPQEEEHVEVAIDAQSHLYLNDETVDLEELKQRLHAMKSSGILKQVLLRADKRVPYGQVVMVMASIREMGITDLGLVTAPEEVKPKAKGPGR